MIPFRVQFLLFLFIDQNNNNNNNEPLILEYIHTFRLFM